MKKSIVFFTRSQLSFFGSNLPAVAVLDLPLTLFQDMEIINKEEFVKAVEGFIAANKIDPSEFMQVLNTDLIFEKEINLQETPPVEAAPAQPTDQKPPEIPKSKAQTKTEMNEKIKVETESFLKVVPFENIISLVDIKDKKPAKIYVANKDLFETVNHVFQSKGFVSQGITSLAIIGHNPVTTLDPHTAGELLSSYEKLKHSTFPLAIEEIKTDGDDDAFPEDTATEGSSNKKMIMILVALVLILGGLGYVLWTQFTTKPVPTKTATPKKKISPTVSVSSSATTIATPSATLNEKQTAIQILNGSGVPGQADQVKNDFIKAGFSNVTTGNSTGVALSQTLAVFSEEIDKDTQEKIISILRTKFAAVTSRVSGNTQFDVSITTVRLLTPTPSPETD